MEKDRKLIRAKDTFIIACLLIAALVLAHYSPADGKGIALVTVDGAVVGRIALDRDGEHEYPELPNVMFTVENGGIRVSQNDCADLTCMRTGSISRRNEAIVCLPKKMAVTIESDNTEVDAVLG